MSCCGVSPISKTSTSCHAWSRTSLRHSCEPCARPTLPSVSPEGQDAAALMAAGFAARPSLLRSAFKHLFSARKSDWEKFDGIFDAFWLGKRTRSRSVVSGSAKAANNPSLKNLPGRPSRAPCRTVMRRPTKSPPPTALTMTVRARAAWKAPRVRTIWPNGLPQHGRSRADRAGASSPRRNWPAPCARRLTRRDLARRRGYRIDLRRTIHANISRGGVPISLVKRQRKQKPLRLVVLLDASGSMSMYTGVFLRFIHGVLDEFREAEAFLFHTRLAHVSDAMKEKDASRALDRLSIMAQGAGGGTRIGESLRTFNRWHAARVIHSRTCVMIVSDGYETGDARPARPRDGGARPPLPPHRLAQSDDGVAGLRAGGARHQGGAAPYRPLRAGQHAGRA